MKEETAEQAMVEVVDTLAISLARAVQTNMLSQEKEEEIPEEYNYLALTIPQACDRIIAKCMESNNQSWLPEAMIKHKLSRKEIYKKVEGKIDTFDLDKKVYSMVTGDLETGYGREERNVVKYRGRTTTVQGLFLKSVDDAHKVMKMAGHETYIIYEHRVEIDSDGKERIDTWRGRDNPVFTSQDILDYNEASTKAAEEEEAEKKARVKRINKLPEEFPVKTYKDDKHTVDIFVRRKKATYNRRQSRSIQTWSYLTYKKDGEEPDRHRSFSVTDFISRDGKKLRKKFKEEMNWYFSEEIADAMMEDFEFLLDKEKEIKNQILNA